MSRTRPEHHLPDGSFRNPWPDGEAERGFADMMRWARERRGKERPVLKPGQSLALADPRIAQPRAGPDELRVTWVGHATFLIQAGGVNLLTDPVWSDRASPVPWAEPRRLVGPGVAFDELPPIDAVLVSHDHYDHLDAPTIRRLAERFGDALVWIAPLGHRRWLERRGAGQIRELDWWQNTDVTSAAASVRVTACPAQHWTRRRPFGISRRLWVSFVIESPARRVFFCGDSGYSPAFRQIRERLPGPGFDAVLLPIGAYEPRWFMRGAHMDPAEAVRVYGELGGEGHLVPMHWGTFILTDEPVLEPPARLSEAWAEAKWPADKLSILRHGETLIVPDSP